MLTFRNARKEEAEEICGILTDAYMDYDFFSLYEENLKKRWNFIYEIQMKVRLSWLLPARSRKKSRRA